MKAIILAAGVGKRLGQYTNEPKCLLQIDGETLLRRYMRVLDAFNVRDIILVAGYKHEKLETEVKESGFGDRVKIVVNPDFEEGSILSLWHARKELNDDVLIMDADVYFVEEILDMIFSSPKKDFFLLDTTSINDGEAVMVGFDGDRAVAQARGLKGNFTVLGEMVGFTRLSAAVADKMSSLLERKVEEGERNIGYEFLFSEMFDVCPISYVAVDGLKWVEIDFPEDVLTAQGLAAEKKGASSHGVKHKTEHTS
ncbi:MAG: phosphocholine cytidylyltransferase family protein [Thermodesulfobacteriota bacterium]|nr:phosphocholine cytidylyltransferase family protein [Thermodesulfobacteriota bacterium]